MKNIAAFVIAFFLIIGISNAANMYCGAGSSTDCPTAGTECSGANKACFYPNCTCLVSSQTIDGNTNYTFANFTLLSGQTLTVSAAGGAGGDAPVYNGACGGGSNGAGWAAGGSGGTGGYSSSGGGSYGGGGGGGGQSYNGVTGCAGGSYSGGGGGGRGDSQYGDSGGNGGTGGGTINISANYIRIAGTITANGNNGASLAAAYYSGAGGGGGAIFLYGNTVNLSGGTINANGGNGGSCSGGSYDASGGGGGGGYIQIVYACTYTAGTYSVANGVPGTAGTCNGGDGAAGGAGSSSPSQSVGGQMRYGPNINVTFWNQTNIPINGGTVNIYYAGTSSCWCCEGRTDSNGFFSVSTLGNPSWTSIYDVKLNTSHYKQDIWYRGVRSPNTINVSSNRKWIPETTQSDSRLFTAGQIFQTELHLFNPYASYVVSNLSIDDSINESHRIISNIFLERFNSTGRATCEIAPDTAQNYYIDKTECSFLSYLNVTNREWIRISYRVRIPGPENYTVGEIKTYNIPTALLRFDVELFG
ncbi:MAG: hypothetical protein V1900_02715 [Candidatus Aenigmatarchaeota archaeon]